jgi:hypothetical protein
MRPMLSPAGEGSYVVCRTMGDEGKSLFVSLRRSAAAANVAKKKGVSRYSLSVQPMTWTKPWHPLVGLAHMRGHETLRT